MSATDLEFFCWDEGERALLEGLRPVFEEHAEDLVAAFYRHLLAFPETRRHLRDAAVKERLLVSQRAYLLSLAGPVVDEDYRQSRVRIGETHERLGIEPAWYMGAYSLYLSLLTPLIFEHWAHDAAQAERIITALQRLVLFDAQIAMQAYIGKRQGDLEYLNTQLGDSSRRLAKDLEETGVALQRTTERAAAAERLADVGVLVAGLAHEIGTPMGVIQGHAQLLEPTMRDDSSRWRLRTIREQVDRIQRIMQSLLNMARPGRHRQGPVDLGALVTNTLAFIQEKLARHEIEVVTDLEPTPSVHGEAERLQQVLLNLFLNATDAMPDGGTLRVSLQPQDSFLELCISDTGGGIPEDRLDRIFEPFFTTKAAGEGNGLGLAVAHGIVNDHGGDLEVAASSPEGTTFCCRIPLAG